MATAVCTAHRIAFIAAPHASEFFALVRNHERSWDDLVRELASDIIAASYDYPALCIIELRGTGSACFVFGDPGVRITTAGGTRELSIAEVSTWFESRIPEALVRVEIGDSSGEATGLLFDGAVSAGGLVATFTDHPEQAPATPVANVPVSEAPEQPATLEPVPHPEPEAVPFSVASVVEPPAEQDHGQVHEPDHGAAHDSSFDPTLTTMVSGSELSALKRDARNPNPRRPSAPGDSGDPAFQRPQLRGVRCPVGHLNSLQDSRCRTCGAQVEQGGSIDTDVRPTLAVVTFDEGTVMELDRPFVLGREVPEPYAISGEVARSISLEDPSNLISRVHLEIHLSGWDIELIDKGSANGTFTRPIATATTKTRLHTGHATAITLGTTVEIGGRSFSITAGGL